MAPTVSPADAATTASPTRPAWVEIDQVALAANAREVARRIAPSATTAVVKADAYGHGAIACVATLAAEGIEEFAVGSIEEGRELRDAEVGDRVLLLGQVFDEAFEAALAARLTPSIASLERLRAWALWARRRSEPIAIELEIDTGMTRLGLAPDELGEALALLEREPRLVLGGVFSHFAEAERPASPTNARQREAFARLIASLPGALVARLDLHLANGAGALHQPDARWRRARVGLPLYGYDPTGLADPALRPVMRVVARAVQVRDVPAGTRVGYGGRFTTERPSRLATVPVGYADGYPWALGGRGVALARGRRVAVVGAVSMDMLAIDVTEIGLGTGFEAGEEVVLLGAQGDERIGAPELADRAGTMTYELLCRLGRQRLGRRPVSGSRS